MTDEARTKGAKVYFASLMDTCHSENAELETKHQKYKGRVVLRGDVVKDDSGSYAVFTEQVSSAAQMTAAKSHGYHFQTARLLGTSSRRSMCFYQDQSGRCSQIVQNSKIGVSRHFGFVYHDTNCLNHGPVWKIQSYLLSEICMIILWKDCYGKGNLRKSFLKHSWEKVSNWEYIFVHREKG